ncbi:hypothetical protein MT325_m675L [Paramecium bursaria chlorella virus MT325]|uniref:Uncharacterized protein m675L n=1 Tax=Paramecium bursaria Chlorella virus MT325 TaxID=346932 RepID=A7IV55_PBCVM|nr:hypothetical protein MT325_m675L [Paramecium bursaria chlorella virus MT325]
MRSWDIKPVIIFRVVKVLLEELACNNVVRQGLSFSVKAVETVLRGNIHTIHESICSTLLVQIGELRVMAVGQILYSRRDILHVLSGIHPVSPRYLLSQARIHKVLYLVHLAITVHVPSIDDDGLVEEAILLAVSLLHRRIKQIQQKFLKGRNAIVNEAEAQRPGANDRI